MVNRELSIKFDLRPCSEKPELTDDGRTDDGSLSHDSSSKMFECLYPKGWELDTWLLLDQDC